MLKGKKRYMLDVGGFKEKKNLKSKKLKNVAVRVRFQDVSKVKSRLANLK